MENKKADTYIKIMIFFYSIFAIAISFMIANNLFFIYLEQTEQGAKVVLWEALHIGNIIFIVFTVYCAIKTLFISEIEEKFNVQNKTALFLFVTCFLFIIITHFFQLLEEKNSFNFYSWGSLIIWLIGTLFMVHEKQNFIKEEK